jgi:MerR family transcriptional regulator/heat shock protein HspR
MVDSDRGPDRASPVFVISVAAQLAGMHPQTLRQYDRLGLVSPGRTAGRGRRYSHRDIDVLREVQRLSQEEGINLAGVKRILSLQDRVAALTARVRELEADLQAAHTDARRAEARALAALRRDLVPFGRGDLVPWRKPKH